MEGRRGGGETWLTSPNGALVVFMLIGSGQTESASMNGSLAGPAQGPIAPGSHCLLPPVIANELLYSSWPVWKAKFLKKPKRQQLNIPSIPAEWNCLPATFLSVLHKCSSLSMPTATPTFSSQVPDWSSRFRPKSLRLNARVIFLKHCCYYILTLFSVSYSQTEPIPIWGQVTQLMCNSKLMEWC